MCIRDRAYQVDYGEVNLTGAGNTAVEIMTIHKSCLLYTSIDQVMVGDMERSRLKEIKALFFVGVNEGNIRCV